MSRKRIIISFCCPLILLGGSAPAQEAQQGDKKDIQEYSQKAERALAAKDWEAAAAALEKLAQRAPKVPEVQGNLGLAYYSQGRVVEAAKALERALALNAKMAQARRLLGLCYAELGRNREATAILEPAFRAVPANADDRQWIRLVGLALERAQIGLKDYSKATAVSDELLRRYPDDPEILFQTSRLHAERSYEAMKRLIRAAPDSAWVHYASAEVHESLGQYDLAIAEYHAVLEEERRLPGVHFRIGRALLLGAKDAKVVDEAQREFEAELAVAPESAYAEYELGEILRQRGQAEGSIEHFTRALRFQPQLVEARIGLARVWVNLGRPLQARPHLEEATRLDPQNEVAHFLLASAFKALGDTTRQQAELAEFRRLRAAGLHARAAMPGTLATSEVTPQTLAPEESPQP